MTTGKIKTTSQLALEHQATADYLLGGVGSPRTKAQIHAEIVAALAAAHAEGAASVGPAARTAALLEVRAILAGIRASVAHHDALIERELADIVNAR